MICAVLGRESYTCTFHNLIYRVKVGEWCSDDKFNVSRNFS